LRRQISNRGSATTPTSAGVATDTPTLSSSAAAAGTPTPIDGGTYNVVVAGEDGNVTVGSKRKLKSDVWLEFEQVTVGGKLKAECDVECVEYAEVLAESEALIADLESLSKEVPDAKRHAGNFEPTEAVKSVPLDPSNDASKQVWIGSELDPK
jgi:hypothetical protein